MSLERRDRHPRAERRCIHPVIGMQDVSDIERLCCLSRRFPAIEQVKKMRSFAQIVSHRRERVALAGAVEVGGNHADFGGNADGTAVVGIYTRAFLAEAAVIKTKHRNRRAHHIHGIRVSRSGLDKIHNPLGKFAFGTQLGAEFVKLRTIRQSAMPEQVDDLLVGGLAGEFVYVVTTIDENSFALHARHSNWSSSRRFLRVLLR